MKFFGRVSLCVLLFSAGLFAGQVTLSANDKGPKGIAANNGLRPPANPQGPAPDAANKRAGNNADDEMIGIDDHGPSTPAVNPEEETAEDKEFLNASESADFQEIEVEE